MILDSRLLARSLFTNASVQFSPEERRRLRKQRTQDADDIQIDTLALACIERIAFIGVSIRKSEIIRDYVCNVIGYGIGGGFVRIGINRVVIIESKLFVEHGFEIDGDLFVRFVLPFLFIGEKA